MGGNVVIQGKQSSDRTRTEEVFTTSNAVHSYETSQIGGGENEDSEENAITRITENSNISAFIDGTTTEQTVSSAPARLNGIMVLTALTGTVALNSNSVALFTLPASWPVGMYKIPGARFEVDMTITLSNAADDVILFWRPI